MSRKPTKYVFVTGGVVSSHWKGSRQRIQSAPCSRRAACASPT